MRIVSERAPGHRLLLQLPTCEMVTQRINYLGFVREPGKVSADPKTVKTIQEWPEELTTKRQVRDSVDSWGTTEGWPPTSAKRHIHCPDC